MHNLNNTKFKLFDWCVENNIEFILERPILELNNFSNNETNLIAKDKDAQLILDWVKSENISAIIYKNDNGYKINFNTLGWQLNLITKFCYFGIPYLKLADLFVRKESFGAFFHLEDVDQLIILTMKRVTNTNPNFIFSNYENFLLKVLTSFPNAIMEKLVEMFGVKYGLEIFEDLRKNELIPKTKYSLGYLLSALKSNGIYALYTIFKNLADRFRILIFYPKTELNKK